MAPRPSEIVHEAPAVLKIVMALVLFIWLVTVALGHARRPPPPAPCPPKACQFHPHAPHKAVSNP